MFVNFKINDETSFDLIGIENPIHVTGVGGRFVRLSVCLPLPRPTDKWTNI